MAGSNSILGGRTTPQRARAVTQTTPPPRELNEPFCSHRSNSPAGSSQVLDIERTTDNRGERGESVASIASSYQAC
jgi:hypothetical protein